MATKRRSTDTGANSQPGTKRRVVSREGNSSSNGIEQPQPISRITAPQPPTPVSRPQSYISQRSSGLHASVSMSQPLSRDQFTLPRSQTLSLPVSQLFPYTQSLDTDTIDFTTEEDELPIEFYAPLETKVVGVRYYNGYAQPGESVLCRREPSNPYDSNAIRVDNVFQTQIGHIPRQVAAKLAAYMDNDDLVIESKLIGEKGMYAVPIRLYLYGPSDRTERMKIEAQLISDRLVKLADLNKSRKQADLKLAEQKSDLEKDGRTRTEIGLKAKGSIAGTLNKSENAPEIDLEELHKLSEAVNFRHSKNDIVQSVMNEETLSKLPMAGQPEFLISQLLPYQLQGLAWLTAKENPKFPEPGSEQSIQLWQRNIQGRYVNIASQIMVSQPPRLLSGGILADDMGLGKTLQVISLIMTGGKGTTLIVAPVSVMSNWKQQMEKHVKPEFLPKILIYHTGSKPATGQTFRDYFSQFDVVITTYGKVASEAKSRTNLTGIYEMVWRRVVLDEGHVIRNFKSKVSQAACRLNAQSRWVISGTPIVNSVKDLHSLLVFLRITGGVEDPLLFSSIISRPLGFNNFMALSLLQNIMCDLCLRRKKDMKFVDLRLPPKMEYVHRIAFRPEEKIKYDTLLAEAKGVLEEHIACSRSKLNGKESGQRNNQSKFQGVLERLLRLRQTCNHWTLCKSRHEAILKLLEEHDVVELNDKNKAILQQALSLWLESQEDCPICMEPTTDALITHCKHVFCRSCITRTLQLHENCPMCRRPLSEEQLLEPVLEAASDKEFDGEIRSSKTEALVQILRATLKKEGSKIVVFSQWTSFLNIVEQNLENTGIRYVRVDGSMKPAERDMSMSALDNDTEVRVMLASLGVCSVGLNLVSADTIVLADSWWAPAIEDQAVDRVHRLGQRHKTTVWRLVMEGTVEEHVLDIQAEKRNVVAKAFHDKDGERKKTKETRMADIMKLLG